MWATSNTSIAHTAIDIGLHRTNSDRTSQLIIMIILNIKWNATDSDGIYDVKIDLFIRWLKKMFVNPMKFIYRSFCLGSIVDPEREKYDQIRKLC